MLPSESRPTVAGWVLLGLVKVYKVLLSPILGGYCRFTPSCSDYAAEAIRTHGALAGASLALRRLAKCRPCGAHGFDPVPRT